jgi:hypothetical protein
MSAQRARRRVTDGVKQVERESGVFLVPASGRVARRGSTRVEPTESVEQGSRGRGLRRHDTE